MEMKKNFLYRYKELLASIALSMIAIVDFRDYFQTGCTTGRMGNLNCGEYVLVLPIVCGLGAIYCLIVFIRSLGEKK